MSEPRKRYKPKRRKKATAPARPSKTKTASKPYKRAANGFMTSQRPTSGLLSNLWAGAAFALVSELVESGKVKPIAEGDATANAVSMERSSYEKTRAVARDPPPAMPFPHSEAKPPTAPPPRRYQSPPTAAEAMRESFAAMPRRERSPSVETTTEVDLTDDANFQDLQALDNLVALEKHMPTIPIEGAASAWEGVRRTVFPETGEEIIERADPPKDDFNISLPASKWKTMNTEKFEGILKHHGVYDKYKAIGGLGQNKGKGRVRFILDYGGNVPRKYFNAEKPFEPSDVV